MSTMSARYAGHCLCGASFGRGATINYNRARRRVEACPGCNPTAAAMAPAWVPERKRPWYADPIDTAYENQRAAACGLDSLSGSN